MSEKRTWCAVEGRDVVFGEGSCIMCQLARLKLGISKEGATAAGPQSSANPAPRTPKEGWKQ